MPIDYETKQPPNSNKARQQQPSKSNPQVLACLLATLGIGAVYAASLHLPGGDTDGAHYLAMASGHEAMKPFAFRFLAPDVARLFAHLTGSSPDHGLLILGMLSGWVLFYGVLSLVLGRRHGLAVAVVLLLTPFWLRSFVDYQLPDLPHAALVIVYLLLLRRRWWAGASFVLVLLYLTRESTLLLAIVAIPVLWRLVSRRAGLMHAAAALVGMAGSKFVSRHALPNHQNMNDTLYMIAKIPWNLSRNVFGLTLWTNTLPIAPPVRVWNLPHWIHAGDVHQIGYSPYFIGYQIFTFCTVLTSFGVGLCLVLCLWWRVPLRALLPRDQPYLCIAALYGAAAYFLAPMLGAGETRLLDYGWPLFLVFLPAALIALWSAAPRWAVYTLVALDFIDAWIDLVWQSFGFLYIHKVPIIVCCNIVAAWLLLRSLPKPSATIAFD